MATATLTASSIPAPPPPRRANNSHLAAGNLDTAAELPPTKPDTNVKPNDSRKAVPTTQKPRFVSRGDGPLSERYRPRKWREIVGQDAALKKLELLRTGAGLSGRAYWISGLSGTGKTTIAYCLASHVSDHWGIDEIDAKDMNAARVKELERQLSNRFITESDKTGRAVIINEAHLLSKDSVGQFLTTLEGCRIPKHVIWIFTTTTAAQKTIFDGKLDAFPFVSRCVKLELSPDVGLAFARRAREIAQAEGLDGGKDEQWFLRLVLAQKCSMRGTLQEIETGAAL